MQQIKKKDSETLEIINTTITKSEITKEQVLAEKKRIDELLKKFD